MKTHNVFIFLSLIMHQMQTTYCYPDDKILEGLGYKLLCPCINAGINDAKEKVSLNLLITRIKGCFAAQMRGATAQ